MRDHKKFRPTVLIILDGFGVAPQGKGNAIRRAATPRLDQWIRRYPAMTLRASGEEVGLSWGEMGNSEVGHLAIGAGRVYDQMFPRINRAIESGLFFENAALLKAVDHVKKHQGRLHIVGLVSAGRVHAMDTHLHALLELCKKQKLKQEVFVHAMLDGRDTVYNAGIDFITTLQERMKKVRIGKLASLSGRFYAMDRDHRWDRTQKAYEAIVHGEGETATNAIEAIKASYAKEIFDEDMIPTVLTEDGKPIATIQENDAVIFFNFRPDRMRQLTHAFVTPTFDGFERTKIQNLFVVTMAEYEKNLPVEVAFPPEIIQQCLTEVLSAQGLKQLHIAETEKYAHITFFLNGMREEPFPGEQRVIIPSPKVVTYDEKPEMSAYELTDRVLKELQTDLFDFFAINFANPDMVAHTGDVDATIKAVEVVDVCLGKIVDAVLARGGLVCITADHGNAEELLNLRTGEMDKEHATNPVPFLIIGKSFEGTLAPSGEILEGDLSLVPPIGMLADVAPTILRIVEMDQPKEMTGNPLI